MFFFCKQKTAYEMRISDWSSDVCSSDLLRRHRLVVAVAVEIDFARILSVHDLHPGRDAACRSQHLRHRRDHLFACRGKDDDVVARTEERRVGKESVSTC